MVISFCWDLRSKIRVKMKKILSLLLSLNMIGVNNNSAVDPKCAHLVPQNYVKLMPPDPITMVQFQYHIINFDIVDVQDHVSKR